MGNLRKFTTALRKFAWRIGCGIVCGTVLILPALALNPAYQISQYGHTSWGRDVSVETVRRIRQTPDGYLWLATRIGLIRFDGVRFTTFKAGSSGGLESSAMQDLLIDPDGSIWIATFGGGLAHYQAGKFRTYTVKDGLPSLDINSLFRDSHGTLWIGTRGAGIARMANGRFEKVPAPIPPSRITAFAESPDHSLWIATYGFGVFCLKNGTIRSFTVKDGLPDNNVVSLYRDHAGIIWTTGRKGISSWDGARFVANAAVNALASQVISCFEDREGDFWIASYTGLLRVHGKDVAKMDRSMGLSSDFVYDAFEDREGNLWVGTSGGLDRLRDEQVKGISQPGPVVSNGKDVLTLSNGQISQITANSVRSFPVALPKGTTVLTLSRTPEGSLLIGSDKGVWNLTGQTIRSVPELSKLSVLSILQSRDGTYWIGTANRGLLQWKRSRGSGTLTETGVSDDWIVTLAQDPTGAVWAGSLSGAGLYRVAEGKVMRFGTNEGLRSTVISSVYVDHSGQIWIGSAGGLSWFKDGRFLTVNSQQGLAADQVFGILDDSSNRIWLAGYAGIAVIDKARLFEWASGVRHELKPVLYPFPQGAELRARPQFFPSAVRSADGNLWFGGVLGGLFEVTPPDPAASHTSQFPVLVEDVTVDGVAHSEPSRVSISPGMRSIEIRYTALTLSNPESVRFRYQLEGFDNDWVDAATRRLAFYNNLKPGTYTFRVSASTDQEKWQESSALVLDQLPFFYQTKWFLFVISVTALSVVFLTYRLRLRLAVDRINAGFQQRMDERMRIARELHDTLLQSFQALIFQFQAARNMVPRRPDDAVHALDEAIAATAQAITEGRDAIGDLRPDPVVERDLAELLNAAAQELAGAEGANGHPPTFRVVVEGKPQTISKLLQDEVYRIACEAIRNAFLHARASNIEAEVHYDKHQLRLRIRDDGKGIDPNILAGGGRSGHWGIPGILERAKRIGAQPKFWTEEGAGTEVELALPAAIAYEKVRDGRRFQLFRGGSG